MAMLLTDTYKLTGTVEELSRVVGCSTTEFEQGLSALESHKACDCHRAKNGIVTLMSRRLERAFKSRVDARLRKQRERCHGECHANVPSASASASVSSSSFFQVGGMGEGVFLP